VPPDDDVAAPAPGTTRVLEHREQQEVLEPHHEEVGPVDRVDRARTGDARGLSDRQVADTVYPCGWVL